MVNPIELIKRNRYFLEGAEVIHTSPNHVDDMQEFHLPLWHIHHGHLHAAGIASGLEVSLAGGGHQVEVQPGVAVDGGGRLIVLSPQGHADISLNVPEEPGRQISPPFVLDTTGLTAQDFFLTIQFFEHLGDGNVGGKLEQRPWLRLQTTTGDGAFVDDGTAVILAIVTVAADGAATLRDRDAALPGARQLMGGFASELRIRRSATVDGRVGQDLAAAIGAEPHGGLRVTVQEAADSVSFSRAGGDAFATFAVQAADTRLQGSLKVADFIDAPDIRKNGTPVVSSQWDDTAGGICFTAGNVGIGTSGPTARLEVAGDWTGSDGALRLSGDKPTLRFTGGQASGNQSWLLHVGSYGPGNLEFHRELGSDQWSPVMALTPAGNVGIDALHASERLTLGSGNILMPNSRGGVDGNLYFGGRTDAGETGLRLSGGQVAGVFAGGIIDARTSDLNDGLRFRVDTFSGGTERMRITADGRVGIGTANPLRMLQIGASSDAAFTFEPADASPNAGYIRFGDNTGWKLHIGRSRERSQATGVPLNAGTTGVLMTVLDNGNIGIGTIQPRFKLEINGPFASAAKPGGGMWSNTSDIRLKKDVKPLNGALKKLLKLRGVHYRWCEPEKHGNMNGRQMGLIAQEVEEVFPEWVNTNIDGFKDLTVRGLEALVVEALRELQTEHTALQARHRALQEKVRRLEAKI